MNWIQFKDWAFLGLIGGACAIGVYLLRRIVSSIEALNRQVGQLLTDGSWFKQTFRGHGNKIQALENTAMDHERRISQCEARPSPTN